MRRNTAAVAIFTTATVFSLLTWSSEKDLDDTEPEELDIPAQDELEEQCCKRVYTVYVHTFGCVHNVSDSEVMKGVLKKEGFELVDNFQDAQIVVINSCTVKNPSEGAFKTLINRPELQSKTIILAGCVPQADPKGYQEYSVVGVNEISKIGLAVRETISGKSVKYLSKIQTPRHSLDLPRIRKNPYIEVIPISRGCLGSCTYCKTKAARGKLRSEPTEKILHSLRKGVVENSTELWLCSEDTGAYGLDRDIDIAHLLRLIMTELDVLSYEFANKDFMLRLGMTNPPFILKHKEMVCEFLRHPRVYEFLHIPIQSASNKTLKMMNREYTFEDYMDVFQLVRKQLPFATIATDIICGFPDETESCHSATLQFLEETKHPVVNITQFYSRPGTPASSMKQLPSKVVKRRSREATEVFHSYDTFSWLIDKVEEVWFTDTSTKSNHTIGHNKQYVKVLCPRDESLLGTKKKVRITSATKWHVVGEVEDNPKP